jgi:hypothetical protein
MLTLGLSLVAAVAIVQAEDAARDTVRLVGWRGVVRRVLCGVSPGADPAGERPTALRRKLEVSDGSTW